MILFQNQQVSTYENANVPTGKFCKHVDSELLSGMLLKMGQPAYLFSAMIKSNAAISGFITLKIVIFEVV